MSAGMGRGDWALFALVALAACVLLVVVLLAGRRRRRRSAGPTGNGLWQEQPSVIVRESLDSGATWREAGVTSGTSLTVPGETYLYRLHRGEGGGLQAHAAALADDEPAGEVLAEDTCAALQRALRDAPRLELDERYRGPLDIPPLDFPPLVVTGDSPLGRLARSVGLEVSPGPAEQLIAAAREAGDASPVYQLAALVAIGLHRAGLDRDARDAHLDQLALLASRTLGPEEQAALAGLIADLRLIRSVMSL